MSEDKSLDPQVMALPHPVRLEAAAGAPIDTQIFERAGVMGDLRPYLTDETAPTETIINIVPGMLGIASKYFGVIPGGNMGSFVLMLVRSRLRAYGDPILQVTPALQEMLTETDIGSELPTSFFRPPYPLVYVEFSRPNSFHVTNKQSGLHECEGAYLSSYDIPAHSQLFSNTARNEALQLDPAKPARVVEVVVTGSPIGKQHALDDASQDLMLFLQDEEECLKTVLDRHISFFQSHHSYSQPGMALLSKEEADSLEPIIYQLAKVLLYLNLPESRQINFAERTDLESRLSKLGPKKAAKLKRKQTYAYDRVIVGPEKIQDAVQDESVAGSDTAEEAAKREVRPHWRRGHFRRIRYGEGRREVRIGWIPPTLVNAEAFQKTAKKKPYVVR
ncbi:hypothetical protein LRD18_12415 [Halorhodospira halochloris]|uniref:hypothetical protein n=1 Tax=Halorhodospira halochloris TaxID=1052 RepID=UPI001EE799A0|nr:hypothetical protein [Halorhodospira halochloris]MCG5531642.1 hypothetical protein [Halorhodospira halochloris]